MTTYAATTARWGRLAGLATVLSITACYGTLLAVAVLSVLGVSLTIHTGTWAGAISLFAVLAVIGVGLSCRKQRAVTPLVLAVCGGGVILWVMFGSYSRSLEIIGFVLLVSAVVWNRRIEANR